jgi:signal transduction histidine kinase
MEFYRQTVALISEPPGSLVYHLVLLFALEAAAAIALRSAWQERSWASLRVLLAAGGAASLAVVTLAATLLSILNVLNQPNSLIVLPPLARVASTLLILWMLWLLAFPNPSRVGEVMVVGLTLLTFAAAGIGWALWAQEVGAGALFYNATPQETAWELAQLILLIIGCAAMSILAILSLLGVYTHPDAWPGLVLFGLLLVGHTLHYAFYLPDTSLPGAERLFEIVAIPIFTAIVYRRANTTTLVAAPPSEIVLPTTQGELAPALSVEPAPEPAPSAPPPPSPASPAAPPIRAIDPKAAVALATLNASASPDELAQLIAIAIAHTCRAELTALISPPDETGMISVLSAYDLVLEQFIGGKPFPADDLVMTREALAQTDISQLRPDQASGELRRIANAVGRSQVGPTLVVPLRAENDLIGALVLMALYSNRDWTPADVTLVGALLGPLSDALGGDSKLSRLLRELEITQAQADAAEEARRAARTEADQLALALETARVEAERLNADILQLRTEMEAPVQTVDTLDTLRAQLLAEQGARMADLEAEWQAKVEAADGNTELQLAQASEQQAELTRLRSEADDWRHKYEESLRQFENRIQQDVALHTELEVLRAQAETSSTQAAEVERLRSVVQTLSLRAAEAEQLRAEAPDQNPELERLRAEAQAASEWRAQYGAAAAKVEAAAQREAELVAELDRLRADMQSLLAQASELEALRLELAQARAAPATAATPEARSEREAELQAEVHRLRAELESIEKNAEAFSVLEADLKSASGWREKYEAAQRDLNAYAQREEELTGEVNRLRADQPALAESGDAAQARLQSEVNSLRDQLEAYQWQAAVRQFDFDFLTQQEQQLRKELELTRAELRRFEEAHEAASPPPAAAPEPTRLTTEELGAVTKALNETKAQLAAALIELSEHKTALEETRRELVSRERQLSKAQAVVASLNDQSRQLTEVQTELNDVLKRLADAQSAANEKAVQLSQKEGELATAMAALAELSIQTQTLTLTQKQLAEKERLLEDARAALEAGPGAEPPADKATANLPFLPQASMEVIASLAQELRQPMSAILGYSELLLDEYVGILGAPQRKFLERIKASYERMETLLHDLIRVTDIDSGALQLVPEGLDVMYVVDDAVQSCSAQFRDKGLNLRMDIGEGLPLVSADRDALRQILTHLLSNAGGASRTEGDVILKVRDEVSTGYNGQDSHALFISVRDSGGGIAAEDQPRVFQRFYRADAPLIAGLGDTGVGLSVAKALVEAHGGRIWLTSEPGQGSTFSVLLPMSGPKSPNGAH